MVIVDFVGYSAGLINMFHLVPQVIKSFRTKSTQDISLNYTIIHTIGLSLWVIYDFLINSYPIMIMLSIETILAAYLIFLKRKYG